MIRPPLIRKKRFFFPRFYTVDVYLNYEDEEKVTFAYAYTLWNGDIFVHQIAGFPTPESAVDAGLVAARQDRNFWLRLW